MTWDVGTCCVRRFRGDIEAAELVVRSTVCVGLGLLVSQAAARQSPTESVHCIDPGFAHQHSGKNQLLLIPRSAPTLNLLGSMVTRLGVAMCVSILMMSSCHWWLHFVVPSQPMH